jgi:NADH/F420H2 dehydrogenase subunit C
MFNKIDDIEKLSSSIKDLLPIIIFQNFKNSEYILTLSSQNLIFSLFLIKKNIGFQYSLLSCVSGVDLIKESCRFMVSYELLSLTFNSRLRIKLFLDDYVIIPSIIGVFENANWWEREIWDLYGICFANHSDLRRILTDYGFEGYPLRKDFPLSAFYEFRYDQNEKNIVAEPVILSQEYRVFNYQMSW